MLELSSFQLAGASTGFEADAAALLNLSEDHLDWHGSMAAYAAAKARIFGTRATIVVDRDDAAVTRLVPAPKTLPARKGRVAKVVARRVVTFGGGVPTRADDWGLAVENDMAWLVRAQGDEARGAGAGEIVLQHLMPADALRIRGRHNAAQRARRARARDRDRLPARADAARAARIPRRAAPRRVRRDASTASTPSTTARAPTSARPSRRWSASAASARRPSSSSSSAATARARTSRRWPRRSAAMRAPC